MALTSATSFNSLTWSQERPNPGFQPTYQGPDTFSSTITYTVDDLGMDSVYAVEGTLAPLASTTIDFQSITDFFGQAMVFTRAYTIQIRAVGADLQWGPGATDPLVWFFGGPTDRIVVKDGSDFQYATQYPFAVTSSAKNIDLYHSSPTETMTYQIVVLGGQGAGTTSTTTTSATTVSSTTTAAPTSSSSSSSSSSTSPTLTCSTSTTT